MSGPPIIPLRGAIFEVVGKTEDTVTLKAVDDADAASYFGLNAQYLVNATPVDRGGHGDEPGPAAST